MVRALTLNNPTLARLSTHFPLRNITLTLSTTGFSWAVSAPGSLTVMQLQVKGMFRCAQVGSAIPKLLRVNTLLPRPRRLGRAK